jgi:DNA-directed RNA polymerase subunit RPC12/RpoP
MMNPMTPTARVRYSCRLCGATNYLNVVGRNGAGAIQATRMYRCSGCSVTFNDPKDWRAAPEAGIRAR